MVSQTGVQGVVDGRMGKRVNAVIQERSWENGKKRWWYGKKCGDGGDGGSDGEGETTDLYGVRLRWMCKVKGDGAGDDGDEYESKVE